MTAEAVRSYYAASLAGLRFLEHRSPTGRRFGADADARWTNFRGHLVTADRIDLMIRDADAQWPSSFAARVVFDDPSVSEDDPFGPRFQPLEPVDAEDLFRAVLGTRAPASVREALAASAAAWEVALDPFDVGDVGAAERLVVAGPSAIASLVEAFSENRDLDWTEQVVVIASPPAHRQLAALATAMVNASKPGAVHASATTLDGRTSRRAIVSADAAPPDSAAARTLAGG